MAGIEYTKDTGFSVDASGHVTWQRKMMLFGDSLIDILNSIELPQHGSRHPGNSLLRLTSSTCNEVGNLNGKCQALWEGTYTTSASGFSYRNEKDPWDLAAQNLTSTPFSIREAMTEYYDGFDHKKHDGAPTNTAGDAFEIEQELFGTEYSFIFCEKAKKYEILIVPSDDFGTEGFVRISYCVPTEQIERSLPSFKKLAEEYSL